MESSYESHFNCCKLKGVPHVCRAHCAPMRAKPIGRKKVKCQNYVKEMHECRNGKI